MADEASLWGPWGPEKYGASIGAPPKKNNRTIKRRASDMNNVQQTQAISRAFYFPHPSILLKTMFYFPLVSKGTDHYWTYLVSSCFPGGEKQAEALVILVGRTFSLLGEGRETAQPRKWEEELETMEKIIAWLEAGKDHPGNGARSNSLRSLDKPGVWETRKKWGHYPPTHF